MNRFIKIKREFKRTRHKIVIFTASIILILLLLKIHLVPRPPVVSCRQVTYNYSLPLLKVNNTLPTRSIFFIDSCAYNFTSRQSCAIESAAKSNPKWQINYISSGMSLKTMEKQTQFRKYKNIKFWNVPIEEISKGTPLERLIVSDIFKNCWIAQRTVDVLKYLILAKWSGIYIDLDMIVVRPLGSLARNWVTRENYEEISERIFGFSKDTVGRSVAESVIRAIQTNFKNYNFCNNERIMKGILQKLCSTYDVSMMSSAICNGFDVYGSQFFYPVEKQKARDLFTRGELVNQKAYTYYLWGQDTKDYKVMKGSPYTKLAKSHCPNTYELYKDNFGL